MKMKHKVLFWTVILAMTAVLFSCNSEVGESTPESTPEQEPEQVSFREVRVNDHWHYSLFNEYTNVITVNSATENSINFTVNYATNPENLEHMLQVVFDGQYEADKTYKFSYKIKGPSNSNMNVCCWVTKNQGNLISSYNVFTPKMNNFVVRCDTTNAGGLLFFPAEIGEYTISDIYIATYDEEPIMISKIEDPSYNGIKIKIEGIASRAAVRSISVNDLEVSNNNCIYDSSYSNFVFADEWAYPYTEAGRKYEISILISDNNYTPIQTSNILTITATSGQGEWYFENKEYEIQDNCLIFETLPVLRNCAMDILYGDDIPTEPIEIEPLWIEIETTDWNWQSMTLLAHNIYDVNNRGSTFTYNNDFCFPDHVNDTVDCTTPLMFKIWFDVRNEEYGTYRFVLWEHKDTHFHLN